MRDVCISVPTVVGRSGVLSQLEIELWPKEASALQHSATVLRGTIDQVLKTNPKAAGKAVAGTPARAAEAGPRPVRVTMGSGGGNVGGGGSRVTISGLGNGNGNGRGMR
jgi:L-lactate dehydrogenase